MYRYKLAIEGPQITVAIIINADITKVILNSNNLVGIHVLNFILSYNFILIFKLFRA